MITPANLSKLGNIDLWKETTCCCICGAEANAEQLLGAERVCRRRGARATGRSRGSTTPETAVGLADPGCCRDLFPRSANTLISPSTAWMTLSSSSFHGRAATSNEKGHRGWDAGVLRLTPERAQCLQSVREPLLWEGARGTYGTLHTPLVCFQADPNHTSLLRSYKSCS